MLVFWMGASVLLPCALQVLLLCKTRRRLRALRWILLSAVVLLLLRAARASGEAGGLFPGLGGLAALFLTAQAVLILAGWGLGWLIFFLGERRR